MAQDDDEPIYYDDGLPDFGCIHCQFDGWHHGCCDDMCIGSNEPEWCENAYPCRHCNPHGEIR